MYIFLTLLFTVAFTALAWHNLRLACFFILATLPLYLIRFSLGPFPLTLLEIMILITGIIWIFKYKGYQKITKHYFIPIIILIAAATVSVFVAPNIISALGIWKSYFLEPILFFYILHSLLNKKEDVYNSIKALMIGAGLVAMFAVAQKITGFGIPEPWDVARRVTSIFPYPNAVGLYLAPIIGLSAVVFWNRFKTLKVSSSVLWLVFLITSILAVIFSQTEAAWIAIPAGLWLITWVPSKTRRWSIPFGLGLILVLLLAPGISQSITNKLFLQDYSGQIRLDQWAETINYLKGNLLFGSGLSGYPIEIEPYHQNQHIEIFQYPHNIFLNTWVELGLLGLIGLFALIIETFHRARTSFLLNKKNQWITLGCLAALVVMFIHGLVDVPYFKNDLAVMTWSIFAILASANKRL